MENEDVIREQMEDTRTSLTDKLETLEKQVANTVTDATTNVTDTVEAVKESVQETISAVKESMHQGVEAVKDFFDLPSHVDHHPWAMVGGSVVLGYIVGSLVGRASQPRHDSARTMQQPSSSRAHTNGRTQGPSETTTGWLGTFGPEIAKLKSLAISSLLGAVSDMIHKSVPPDLGSSLEGIIAGVTEKLTGVQGHSPKGESGSYPNHREVRVGD